MPKRRKIDRYITKFDGINEKMEIEIPFDVLFDEKKNSELSKFEEISWEEEYDRNKKRRFAGNKGKYSPKDIEDLKEE
jgi:hypothetical protein